MISVKISDERSYYEPHIEISGTPNMYDYATVLMRMDEARALIEACMKAVEEEEDD